MPVAKRAIHTWDCYLFATITLEKADGIAPRLRVPWAVQVPVQPIALAVRYSRDMRDLTTMV